MVGKAIGIGEVRELMERLGITPELQRLLLRCICSVPCGRETGEIATGDEMAVSGGSEAL